MLLSHENFFASQFFFCFCSVVIKIIRLCRGTNCNIINLLNAFTIIKGKERNWPAIRFHVSRDFLCEQHRLCMLKKSMKEEMKKIVYSVFIELVSLYLVAIQHISIVSFLHKYTLPWMLNAMRKLKILSIA